MSGLQQPPGTTVTASALYSGQFHVGLINGRKSAFEMLSSQIEMMNGAELITAVNTADGQMIGYQGSGGTAQITVNFVSGDIVITATK